MSVDGKTLISLGYDGIIIVFDLKSEIKVKEIECNYNSWAVKISNAGKYIAASENAGISLWSTENWLKETRKIHEKNVNILHFSQDDEFIVTGGDDGAIGVTCIKTFCSDVNTIHSEPVGSLVVIDDFAYSLAGDSILLKIRIQKPEKEFQLTSDDITVDSFILIPQKLIIFAVDANEEPFVQIW